MSALIVYAVDTAIVGGLLSASYLGLRVWNKLQAMNLESSEVRKAITELDNSTRQFQAVMTEFEAARQSLSQFEKKIRESDELKQEFQELLDVANLRIERLDDQMKSAMSASVMLNETLSKVGETNKPKRRPSNNKDSKIGPKITGGEAPPSRTIHNVYKSAVNQSHAPEHRNNRQSKNSNVLPMNAAQRGRNKG